METGKLVIDTTVFIEYLRAKDKHKTILYSLADYEQLFISAVTLYELYMGATSSEKKNDVELLASGLTILPFNAGVAQQASLIYHTLRKINKLIEFRDIFIAATCLEHKLPLKTINKNHFERIKALTLV